MLDNLPLVILDDADFSALFATPAAKVSRRDILCKRCICALALLVLAFAGALLPALDVAHGVDVLVFGVSRHSKRYSDGTSTRFHEVNPGLGLGYSQAVATDGDWRTDVTVSGGTYVDSYTNRAWFGLVGLRQVWANRLCADLSTGYYNGSGFSGFAVVPSVGVRVAGPVWILQRGDPRSSDTTAAFVGVFARVHWAIK